VKEKLSFTSWSYCIVHIFYTIFDEKYKLWIYNWWKNPTFHKSLPFFDGSFYSLFKGSCNPFWFSHGYWFYDMFTENLVLWKFLDLSLQWAIILPFHRHKILISVFDGIKVCKCKVNWTLRNNYIASSLLYIRIYSYWWIKTIIIWRHSAIKRATDTQLI